jgi:hypothetical protein
LNCRAFGSIKPLVLPKKPTLKIPPSKAKSI